MPRRNRNPKRRVKGTRPWGRHSYTVVTSTLRYCADSRKSRHGLPCAPSPTAGSPPSASAATPRSRTRRRSASTKSSAAACDSRCPSLQVKQARSTNGPGAGRRVEPGAVQLFNVTIGVLGARLPRPAALLVRPIVAIVVDVPRRAAALRLRPTQPLAARLVPAALWVRGKVFTFARADTLSRAAAAAPCTPSDDLGSGRASN